MKKSNNFFYKKEIYKLKAHIGCALVKGHYNEIIPFSHYHIDFILYNLDL